MGKLNLFSRVHAEREADHRRRRLGHGRLLERDSCIHLRYLQYRKFGVVYPCDRAAGRSQSIYTSWTASSHHHEHFSDTYPDVLNVFIGAY